MSTEPVTIGTSSYHLYRNDQGAYHQVNDSELGQQNINRIPIRLINTETMKVEGGFDVPKSFKEIIRYRNSSEVDS